MFLRGHSIIVAHEEVLADLVTDKLLRKFPFPCFCDVSQIYPSKTNTYTAVMLANTVVITVLLQFYINYQGNTYMKYT